MTLRLAAVAVAAAAISVISATPDLAEARGADPDKKNLAQKILAETKGTDRSAPQGGFFSTLFGGNDASEKAGKAPARTPSETETRPDAD
ncbi:MAG: hypothetical protein ACFBSD_01455 [Paracoccaceae bacterium]